MSDVMTPKARSEHLFRVVTSTRFLTKQGLGNEVPFFICPYPAQEGLSMAEDRKALVTRIEHAGVKVLDLSLYDLALRYSAASGASLTRSSQRSRDWTRANSRNCCKVFWIPRRI